MNVDKCKYWYEQLYKKYGYNAQRQYPNEELIRFIGRTYLSSTTQNKRGKIRILELGCGSGGNIWAISKEGFDTYGLDISPESIRAAQFLLKRHNVKAHLISASMTNIPYKDETFDAVIDIFSSYCLPMNEFDICLKEVSRVLKPSGLFFSYTPSTTSDAFKKFTPSKKIDRYTLNGIHRKSSPYFGNNYPFRFTSVSALKKLLKKHHLRISYLETSQRTYQNRKEKFSFISSVAQKTTRRQIAKSIITTL